MTLAEIAVALYGKTDAKGGAIPTYPYEGHIRSLLRHYKLHDDEFTESMTGVLKLQTPGDA